MNEPPIVESASEPASPPMPVVVRMMNVFAVPGEAFTDVKRSPNSAASWLLPILVASVVGIIAAIILFSQETILHEMREVQSKAMQQQVEKGNLSQAQADEAMATIEKFSSPTIMKISGAVGAIIVSFVRVFWWAFALWLVALVLLRVRLPYLKALEVTGLASLIGTLGILVTLLLQINLGRTSATPSLALAVTEFDPSNRLHMVLGALNLIQVWMVVVMGVGLSRLTNVPLAKATLLVVAFYFLQTSALIMLGAGRAMM